MHVIARRTIREFYAKHPDAKAPLESWYHEMDTATWKSPAEIRARYSTASFIKDNRVVFRIGGNKYRLVVRINFAFQKVFIRFVGTHKEYDRINVEEI
jgi:mRNA interferase HigB